VTTTALQLAVRFRALGYCFDVSSDDAELLSRASRCYQDLTREPGADDEVVRYHFAAGTESGTFRLFCDGEPVLGTGPAAQVLATLLWHVNARTTQRPSANHLVLHAAAAVRDGRTIVLPAPMESGKTTTVSGLVQAGFGYLTDEAAAIHVDDLHVEPFPKSLAVDNGSWHVLEAMAPYDVGGMSRQWQIPVSTLPTGSLAARSPVAFVVLPRFVPGSDTILEPVSRATAVMAMSASTFQFLDAPEGNLDVLARVATASCCYELTIGSLAHAVDLLDRLMATA
jgi:hypothetical protein